MIGGEGEGREESKVVGEEEREVGGEGEGSGRGGRVVGREGGVGREKVQCG